MKIKKSALALFLIGIVLEAIAITFAYPDRFPIVSKLISPDYERGMLAVHILEEKKPLGPESPGFLIVEKILMDNIRKYNPPDKVKNIRVLAVERSLTEAVLAFTTAGTRTEMPIAIHYSNGQKEDWNLVELKEDVEALKHRNYFMGTVVLFCIGLLIQTIGFVRENSHDKKAA